MGVPAFSNLEAGYTKLWDSLVPDPAKMGELQAICQRMVEHKPAYQEVSQDVWGTPDNWFIVAILDQMEGGGGARTHLWDGDPLTNYTVNVPAGEPHVGHGPPFTFRESAAAALRYQGFQKVTNWTGPVCGYQFEGWNGWGYLNLKEEDPYLAAWSNFEPADAVIDRYVADHVLGKGKSGQPGALVLLKVLQQVDPTIKLGVSAPITEVPVTTVTTTTTAPTPVSAPVPAFNLSSVIADVNVGLTVLEQALPVLSIFLGPQLTRVLSAVVKAIRLIEDSTNLSTDLAARAVLDHLTPGQPNASQLS